ncbi:MAG: BMP family ABC transporter substrate-binding protein [Planctomycetota bacterium]
MKRAAWLSLVTVALTSCGPAEKSPKVAPIALVFDVGGRGDKSFNDAAYRGLERAKSELQVEFAYKEPTNNDREASLRSMAEGGAPLVFGVGFLFTDSICTVAKDFPGQKFACIDYDLGAKPQVPANVSAIKFREEEGAFLVGAIAGLTTKTKKVGFVGGMDIPLIHKFKAGYTAGVKAVNPECEVIANFAGLTPDAFKDPVKGKELARAQYGAGADIIFHASGSTGNGVLEEAKERNKADGKVAHFVIGVDSDQWEEGGHVLTSMIKRVDVVVFDTIKAHKEGKFSAGAHEYGLKEDGVGYVRDGKNMALIPDDVEAKLQALKKEIIDRKREVPAK